MRQYPFELLGLEIRAIVGYICLLSCTPDLFPVIKVWGAGQCYMYECPDTMAVELNYFHPFFGHFHMNISIDGGARLSLDQFPFLYKRFPVMSQHLSEQKEWMFIFYQLSDDHPSNWFRCTSFRLWLNLSSISLHESFLVLWLQLESIANMVQGVWSDDPALQIEATTWFRKLLSIGTDAFLTCRLNLLCYYCCPWLIILLYSLLCIFRTKPTYWWSHQDWCYP